MQADAWSELANQWQGLAQQWSQWWTVGAAGTTTHGVPTPLTTAGLAPPVALPHAVWFDPVAAAELTERYQRRFEVLWKTHADTAAAPVASEAHPDRRFAGKEWSQQPFFAWLKDAYLVYSEYIQEFTSLAQADPDTQKRLRFLSEQYVDALAPSNFLATNPEALKMALESGGASIAQGMSNLLADGQRGRIAMSDESAFAVGRNLALTPGSVVFRNELFELIQYAPSTPTVFKRPLLIVPPCINKYYILDLQPSNSLVQYAVAAGHTVCLISWRNIPAHLGSLTWDDYLEDGILTAVALVQDIAASKTVNALGFCVGGTLLSSALSVLAARRDQSVASVTLLATMLDFSDPGDIGVYVSNDALAAREPALMAGGRVQGSELAGAFASLRPNDLVWPYVVNNYLKGQTPPAFDLLYWNGDSSNLPGPMYDYYLRNMYLDNKLREPDALTMCGERVDLSRVSMPSYVFATRDDHIVPWRSAYKTTGLFGGDVTFVLGASGHIAGVINPPSKNRRNYWTNELLTEDADDWFARAESHHGSWWPHWSQWLAKYAGTRHPAPRQPGTAKLAPLCLAPGTYVIEQVS